MHMSNISFDFDNDLDFDRGDFWNWLITWHVRENELDAIANAKKKHIHLEVCIELL